jgi:hypothetical protein
MDTPASPAARQAKKASMRNVPISAENLKITTLYRKIEFSR